MATRKSTASTKKPATAAAAKTDATLLLERDHTEVHKLFKQYEKLAEPGPKHRIGRRWLSRSA